MVTALVDEDSGVSLCWKRDLNCDSSDKWPEKGRKFKPYKKWLEKDELSPRCGKDLTLCRKIFQKFSLGRSTMSFSVVLEGDTILNLDYT